MFEFILGIQGQYKKYVQNDHTLMRCIQLSDFGMAPSSDCAASGARRDRSSADHIDLDGCLSLGLSLSFRFASVGFIVNGSITAEPPTKITAVDKTAIKSFCSPFILWRV